jgi:hypothetical protein
MGKQNIKENNGGEKPLRQGKSLTKGRKRKTEPGLSIDPDSSPDSHWDNIPYHAIKELPTANSKLQTENMEVHHHPQLEHKPKPWKEYLLEGLMIFLAVTMGFFAETIRERISDNKKGNEYIRSFVEDLRTDTANFSELLAFDQNKMDGLNNLAPCYGIIEKDNWSTLCLVPILKRAVSNRTMNFSDGTMQQLKNAGGFRLLNKTDKDSIVAYDHATRIYQNFESTLFQERQNIVRSAIVKLGNFKASAAVPDSIKTDVETPLLFSNDKASLNEFFNDLLLYKKANSSQMSLIKKLKKQAVNLIKYFDNEYN